MLNLIPAKILSYDAATRTAQVQIDGLTDGAEDGLTATFAYPVGHDDRDTEIQVLAGAEVYVFFAGGQMDSPVIAFYRSHGAGAVVDTRRIRQKNIKILASNSISIEAIATKVRGVMSVTSNLSVGTGATGSFVSVSGEIVTVVDGIITNIY
jgi:hypothetical protein